MSTGKSDVADGRRMMDADGDSCWRAFANVAVGFVLMDPSGEVVQTNEAFGRIVGYGQADMKGGILKLLHPDDYEQHRQKFASVLAGEIDEFACECRFLRRHGAVMWARTSMSAIRNAEGETQFIVLLVEDDTARHMSESALIQNEARLRAVLDGVKDAVISIDERGIIRSVNAAGAAMFEYPADELIGRNITCLMPRREAVAHTARMARVLAAADIEVGDAGREVEGLRKFGEVFPLDLSIVETRYGEHRLFVGIARDLSDRRSMELRVAKLQQERLTSFGGMTTAIAHEVNQPLAATGAYIETALALLAQPESERLVSIEQTLRLANEQLMRAGEIIMHIREFVAHGEPDKTIAHLHDLISDELATTLSALARAQIRVNVAFNAPDDEVLIDRVQIKQVLRNLIRNAEEAMADCSDRQITLSTQAAPDGMLQVSVADTGCGLSRSVRRTIFEPFRTTKATGVGIGLSISKSIVEAHFGSIWAENVGAGGGAVFSFTVPLAAAEEEP